MKSLKGSHGFSIFLAKGLIIALIIGFALASTGNLALADKPIVLKFAKFNQKCLWAYASGAQRLITSRPISSPSPYWF